VGKVKLGDIGITCAGKGPTCPSSYKVGHQSGLSIGGSGWVVCLITLLAVQMACLSPLFFDPPFYFTLTFYNWF